jgi:hypothetical protein
MYFLKTKYLERWNNVVRSLLCRGSYFYFHGIRSRRSVCRCHHWSRNTNESLNGTPNRGKRLLRTATNNSLRKITIDSIARLIQFELKTLRERIFDGSRSRRNLLMTPRIANVFV